MNSMAPYIQLGTPEQLPLSEFNPKDKLKREIYTDPKEIQNILSSHFNNCSLAFGYDSEKQLFLGRAECMSISRNTTPLLYWKAYRRPSPGNIQLNVSGFNAVYTMIFSSIDVSSNIIETPLPSVMRICRQREERRIPPPVGTVIRFSHPYWPRVHVEYPVYDVSYHGLSFQPDEDIDILEGWRLLSTTVLHNNRPVFTGISTVQHVSRAVILNNSPDIHDRNICGLRLLFSDSDFPAWIHFVDNIIHDKTSTLTDLDKLWSLYVDSGYFNLSGKTTADFDSIKTFFYESSMRLFENPVLGCHSTWQKNNSPIASVTYTHIYSHTWQLLNLAKQHIKSLTSKTENRLYNRKILREIYFQAIELGLANSEMKWFLTYAKKGSSWTQKVHHDFSAKYMDTGEVYMADINLIEICVEQQIDTPNHDYSIRIPSRSDLSHFVSFLDTNYPRALSNALELTSYHFSNSSTKRDTSEGFYPHREMRVAYYKDTPVAFSVMEFVNEAPSLFGLFDNLKLFSVTGKQGEDAFIPLLYQAVDWFRSNGISKFIYYNHSSYNHRNLPPIATNLGDGMMHILSRDILPTFLEHVFIFSLSN